MRHFIRIIIILFILVPMLCLPLNVSVRGVGTQHSHAAERKEIVVVMPMAAQNLSPDVRNSLTESFIGELIRSDKYEIVSGKIVADAMTEAFKRQKEKKQQCDELACVREVAGNLGADLVLTIKVVKDEEVYLLNAKIENINSGAQIALKDDECEKCNITTLKKKVKLLAVRLMGLEGGETSPSVTATAKKPVVEETRESGSSISQTKAPAPVVLQGHLQVNVNAPSVRVYVNGEDKGTASPGSPLNMENLPTGTASIRVEAEGYESLQRTVTVRRNQWTQEVFELKRIQVASLPPSLVERVEVFKKTIDHEYGDGYGRFKFGASPEDVNNILTEKFGTVEWTTLPIAGEYKTTEARYFWKYFRDCPDISAYGGQNGKVSKASYICFLFRNKKLFRISLRFINGDDVRDHQYILNSFSEKYGLDVYSTKSDRRFRFEGYKVLFFGASNKDMTHIEFVKPGETSYEGQDW